LNISSPRQINILNKSITPTRGLLASPFAYIILTLILSLLDLNLSFAQTCPLGAAHKFAVLAASAVTNSNPTTLVGDLGISPGTAITGRSSVTLTGTVHQTDSAASLAQADVSSRYSALAALPANADLSGQDLGGLILTPGVYRFNSSAQLTGVLTLNSGSDPEALFVFQIGSTLTTASNSSVNVIGGPNGNIFWVVGSSATLGTGSRVAGNILAVTSITLTTGASLQCGSALAQNGAVTMDNNLVINCFGGLDCQVSTTPTPTSTPSSTPTSTPTPGATPVVPEGCIAIPTTSTELNTTTKVFNDATIINKRDKMFVGRAAKCGNSRLQSTTSNRLLARIRSALDSSFITTQLSCSDSICQSVSTASDIRTLRSLVRSIYLQQVKAKRGAIAACPVIRNVIEVPNRKDSKYYYEQTLNSIERLPTQKFRCQ